MSALSIAAFLLYTYYESGQSKNRVEEELNDQAAIEPYEVNEIRFLNTLTPELYNVLVEACMEHFTQHNTSNNTHTHTHGHNNSTSNNSSSSTSSSSTSSSSSSVMGPTTTYPAFVAFVNDFLEKYNQEVLKSNRLAAANKPPPAAKPVPSVPFIASERFDGCKEGYTFTTGSQGLGYYLEKPSKQNPSSSQRGGRRGEGEGIGGGGAMVWIRAGHLFDRLVASHLLLATSSSAAASSSSAASSATAPSSLSAHSSSSSNNNNNNNIDSTSQATVAMKTSPVSVAFLLVALNMAERTAAPQRAGSLFRLASLLDQYQTNHNQQQDDSSNSSSSNSSSNSSSSGGSSSGSSGRGGTVSVSAVTTIIHHLGDSWQVNKAIIHIILSPILTSYLNFSHMR